jgi:hypothetical protein
MRSEDDVIDRSCRGKVKDEHSIASSSFCTWLHENVELVSLLQVRR